jgi:hypothetical protein
MVSPAWLGIRSSTGTPLYMPALEPLHDTGVPSRLSNVDGSG